MDGRRCAYENHVKHQQAELRAILQKAEEIQGTLKKSRELHDTIEHEIAARNDNQREFGNDLPPLGWVWCCDQCEAHLASKMFPEFCPFCEKEIGSRPTRVSVTL